MSFLSLRGSGGYTGTAINPTLMYTKYESTEDTLDNDVSMLAYTDSRCASAIMVS
jgi:hypothetical protein